MSLKTKYLVIILTLAFLLWLLAISATRVFDVSVDARFGLMQYMPWYFWVGVFLLGLANGLAMLGFGSRVMYLPLLTVTMLFVLVPNCFVEPTVTSDAYWHASTFMRLTQTGYIDSSVASYLEWPFLFIIGSALTSITKIDASQLIQYYPLLNGLLLTVGFYLLSKRLLGSDQLAFISTTFMIMGQMFILFHFSPYAMALSLFPLILYLLLSKDVKQLSMGILLSFVLIVTHTFVPVFMLLIIGVIPWLFSRFFKIRSKYPFTAILISISFFGWLIYVGTGAFSSYVNIGQRLYYTLLDLSRFEAVSEAFSGYIYPEISYLRKGVFASYLLMGLLGFLLRFKADKSNKDLLLGIRAGMLIIPSALIFLVPYVLGPLEFTTRSLDFVIFGASINLPTVLSIFHLEDKSMHRTGNSKQTRGLLKRSGRFLNRKSAIVLFSVFLLFLGVTLSYVDESSWLTHPSELAGNIFVANVASSETLIYSNPRVEYIFFNINLTERNVMIFDFNHPYERSGLDSSDIIVFRNLALIRYFYSGDISPYSRGMDYVESTYTFLRIYDSGTFLAYVNVGT